MDGRNPAPVDICGLSHYFRQLLAIQGVFSDFFLSTFLLSKLLSWRKNTWGQVWDFPSKIWHLWSDSGEMIIRSINYWSLADFPTTPKNVYTIIYHYIYTPLVIKDGSWTSPNSMEVYSKLIYFRDFPLPSFQWIIPRNGNRLDCICIRLVTVPLSAKSLVWYGPKLKIFQGYRDYKNVMLLSARLGGAVA